MVTSSAARVRADLLPLLGSLGPGGRLPASRALVAKLGVSATTVQQALAALVAEGLVETRPGAGTFVAARPDAAEHERPDTGWQDVTLSASLVQTAGLDEMLRSPTGDGILPMAVGFVATELQADLRLPAALARAARRPGGWLRPPVAGIPQLRSWFAGQLGAEAEDVIITPGGQAALSTVIRAVVPAGESMLFATPSYPGALAVARSHGLVPVPVPEDEDGVRPDLLERAAARTRARLVYLQPTFGNPTGTGLAHHRRAEILDIAHRHGMFVVEDDWARWLGHGAPVPPPLYADDRHGHVITVNSLTKVVAPSLRVGAITARGQVAARIAALRMVDDLFVSGPLQEAAVEVVTAPGWAVYCRRLSRLLGARAAALSSELRAQLPELPFRPPKGGTSLWLGLPTGVDDAAVARRALAHGVTVTAGRHHLAGDQPETWLRLSYSGLPEADYPEAVRRLARAVADVSAGAGQ
ncbi:aminotransferase class I/II-fold pyridoxal phosphate-dependent enzyme [Nakamurella sp. YIM 132087]|uniref:Aminotransferase class I/II-fold pyridoxal phosphate-dependent enzyme n=1 Tax=Nakamurella alba TaxID=2665158 RepID=A0A7K1FQD0_9ACTN|nr:PLP-dependent aminotransferase family protein [Nakamurella alba]MTD16341.1 aminotransferase class I/II-fold pyridoxal phosphate-dependent enzyme [Nakamurella alba]